jgi:Zn-dependent protease
MFAQIFVLFFAIGLHEYAHCKFADMAGDPTPGIYGRVTLNLTKHFEPAGTIMMIVTSIAGIGIGWGRPAPMDPRKMANPRWDFFTAVAAGPMCNIVQAIIWALVFRVVSIGVPSNQMFPYAMPPFPVLLATFGVVINLTLCFFNLIPFGPLDGHWLVGLLMPEKQRYYWNRFNAQVGRQGLFIVIIGVQLISRNGGPNLFSETIGRPVGALYHILTGTHYPFI